MGSDVLGHQQQMIPDLVSCLVAVLRYWDRSNLKEKGLIDLMFPAMFHHVREVKAASA